MNIIAIDTSTNHASVSLFSNGNIYTNTRLLPRQHNKHLLDMINKLTIDAKIKKTEISVLSYGVGPGSFVGVRLSAAIIQAMSLVTNAPVVGFSSMKSIAMHRYRVSKQKNILVVLNAMMGDVYWGYYKFNQSTKNWDTVSEQCCDIQTFIKIKSEINYDICVGDFIGDMIIPDETSYIPDTQYMLDIILYKLNNQSGSLVDDMPVYMQGTKQWNKL